MNNLRNTKKDTKRFMLSEKLKYWRSERPDEWTMDEFIRQAGQIETNIKKTLDAYFKNDKEGLLEAMRKLEDESHV